MKKFRDFSLVFLSVVCVLLTSSLLIYESFNTTILRPYETINYLDDGDIYLDVEKVIEGELSKKIESMNIDNSIISILLNDIINKSITKEWISYISIDMQTALWDYITDKSDTIGVISLTEFNNYFKEMSDNEVSMLLDSNSILKNLVLSQIEELLPDTIDVNGYLNDYTGYVKEAKNYYQLINTFVVYMYLTLAIILILIFAFALNLRKSTKWLGITFTITGIVTFIPAILLNLKGKQIIYKQIEYFDYYSNFESSITTFIDILVDDITISLSMFSFIVLMLGLFSLLMNKVLVRRSDKREVIRK